MRILFVSKLFFFMCSVLQAQEVNIFAEVNYGTFQMTSLKKFLTPPESYYLPLKVVDQFPGFVGLKAYGVIKFSDRFATGIFVGFTSTGGKSTYSDYSGYIDHKIKCSGFSIGSHNEFTLQYFDKWSLEGTFLMGATINQADFAYEYETSYFQSYISEKYRSVNMLFNPGLAITRQLGNVKFRGLISYELNFAGDLKAAESGEYLLNIREPVRVQWDGLRIGIAVGVGLNE